MGFFDKENEFDKLVKTIAAKNSDIEEKDIYYFLSNINDVNVYTNILYILEANAKFFHYSYYDILEFVTSTLYPLVVNSKTDLQTYYNLLTIYLKNNNLYSKDTLSSIISAFDNKDTAIDLLVYINNKLHDSEPENIEELSKYLIMAREYFVDDRALLSSFYNLVMSIGTDIIIFGETSEINKAIKKKIKEDKKANGIYDLDEAALKEMDRKIDSLDIASTKLNTLLELAKNISIEIKDATNGVSEKCAEIRLEELKKLKDEAEIIIKKFNTSYLELLNKEKESIRIDKEAIIKDIYDEIERKKNSILEVAKSVSQTVDVQLSRIDSASKKSIDQIEDYVSNNENVRKAISDVKSNGDLLEKIAFVQKVSSTGELGIVDGNIGTPIVAANTNIIMANNIETEDIDMTINYYFDRSVKYKERFKKLMEIKAKMIEKGELFHEKFDDVLTMVIENDTPYLWGPSGCGKTYMIEEQLAKILDIEVISSGYIQFEHDILGFNSAGNGSYVPSNFYRAFVYGNMILFDELDNSNSSSTVILNKFITRKTDFSYKFPHGVTMKRHPNFRIIAAGNTKGTGKTEANNTRQKQDESVLQRLTPIYIPYDNRIEMRILKDYPGWYEFAINFRKAIEDCDNKTGEGINYIGTFTTRDAETIRDYLDDKAFNDEKLMDYQIVENKDCDYLSQILSALEGYSFENKEGKELKKLFKFKVEERKKYENYDN